PSYISSHSADVILSDIRPTKLKPDALRATNILLDEFLYKILSISGSLATDKLKASLLGLLPTNLGKEALLEAEVELRAYWERTHPKTSVEDDSRTFHLQWAFELLRLKCEAYSTLNEEDEDPNLEGHVSEKLGKAHPHPPKVGLVDPAALYLTAILESVLSSYRHILSNVGRVVARDSSRTNATINDLFVALCEDDSIYGLFKTMKVYEQIEVMSKGPPPRRSKSFTRNDSIATSPTSSSHQELTRVNSSRSRQSLDWQSASTNPSSGPSSATSFEKSRAIRMFVNSKVSSERDGDSQLSHKKSMSVKSETSRNPFADDDIHNIAEDAAMLREFDDLMRSTSTMKVSLTPDRLRTMEVYKQEKDQRDTNRRPPPHFSLSKSDIPPTSQAYTQKPALHHVNSIIEDEEEIHSPQTRARQGSLASQPTPSSASIIPTRIRSVSTSSTGIRGTNKKPMRSPSVQAAPSSFSRITPMVQNRDIRKGSDNGFPVRTRNRHRESLDLDDVMNGSDDDDDQGSILRNQNLPPTAPRIGRAQYSVSAQTRELMAFLDEGPPEPKISQSGSELLHFLAQGPPDFGNSTTMLDPSKPKGAGRLQRMISKLSIGGEKARAGSDATRTSSSSKQPTSPIRSTISNKPSISTLSSLANRPIPPRPRPISPPPSPYSYDEDISIREDKFIRNPPYNSHQDTPFPRETPVIERATVPKPVTIPPAIMPSNKDTQEEKPIHRPPANQVNGNTRNGHLPKEASSEPPHVLPPPRTVSRKAVPAIDSPSTPFFTEKDAKDMQCLFANATTADECRLIFDMFMARTGVAKRSTPETDAPYSSPLNHAPLVHSNDGEASIESTLVEFFLGDIATPDVISWVLSEQNQPNAPIEAQADVKPAANTPPFDTPPFDKPFAHPLPMPQSSPSAP
ncbi:hypothetical protein BYT27DRAFT_7102846, partial [Phlegmacium glaucopus]